MITLLLAIIDAKFQKHYVELYFGTFVLDLVGIIATAILISDMAAK